MSFVTDFTTKSFPLNLLREAAEDWAIWEPERPVTVVPSHFSADGSHSAQGFAYVPDAETVAEFEQFVADLDDDSGSPWSEYEQGWRNIRAEEAAAVARQNAEDAEWAERPVVTYMGVRGTWQPGEGYIFEP